MLGDFLRINLPYGMVKVSGDKWFVFNREYLPLGWTDRSNPWRDKGDYYSEFSVHVRYKGLTELKLKGLAWNESGLRYDESGKINQLWFYNDGTNPHSFPEHWDVYAGKLKVLSKLTVSEKVD